MISFANIMRKNVNLTYSFSLRKFVIKLRTKLTHVRRLSISINGMLLMQGAARAKVQKVFGLEGGG